MQLQGKALRVIIYIGESDRYQGKALYMSLLQLLKKEQAAGATVVRGLAGFGAHSRIHTATIVDLSADLPLRLEWVDQPQLVERLLPQIRRMVDGGLITLEEVTVVQYAPGRRPDPLAQPVQDVMRREVITVTQATSATEVVMLLLQKGYRSLPVVDDNGRPLGIITDGDLLRRAGLRSRLGLQIELPVAEWQQQLANLEVEGATAADLMTTPVITIPSSDPLGQAVQQMVTHSLKRLPVVDEDGYLVGWVSRLDILRTMEYHQSAVETDPEPPATGRTIADLMYRDVPTVSPKATLEEILQALEQDRRRRVIVVDGERHVVGIITDGDLLRRTQEQAHPALLDRLRALVTGQPVSVPAALSHIKETAADLMTDVVILISVNAAPTVALSLMLQHDIKRMPVVDENGRLLGLLGRASLLRGLMNGNGIIGAA